MLDQIKPFLPFLSFGWTVLITGFNVAMFIVVKFNDFKHMEKSMEELKVEVRNLINSTVKENKETAARLAAVEARCKATHGE